MGRGGARPGAGRPHGARNKATQSQSATLSEIAKSYAPEALEMLAEVMRHGKSDAARVSACLAILDRAFGRPKQADPEPQSDALGDLLKEMQAGGGTKIRPVPNPVQLSSETPVPNGFEEKRILHNGDQLCLGIAEE